MAPLRLLQCTKWTFAVHFFMAAGRETALVLGFLAEIILNRSDKKETLLLLCNR